MNRASHREALCFRSARAGYFLPALFTSFASRLLLPRRGVRVDQALPARAIEQLAPPRRRRPRPGRTRGAPHLLDGRAQLAALGAVERRVGLGLPHALLGGLDSRHDDLE